MIILNTKSRNLKAIKNGTRRVEFKDYNNYWTRLFKKEIGFGNDEFANDLWDSHIFTGIGCDVPCKIKYKEKSILANIIKVEIVNGSITDKKCDKPVYAIYLQLD